MPLPVYRGAPFDPRNDECLHLDCPLVEAWLVEFLRAECLVRRGFGRAVLGISGGVDSAVAAYLSVRAFGPENVFGFRLPYSTSSPDSLEHAALVGERLGIELQTVEITSMVEGYRASEPEITPARLGNVCARSRMVVLFDQSAKLGALPIGTGNKTERLFGYFTWHADDAPPINPLGDLFKTQVWQLARHLGVPDEIVRKAPTADLVRGQTDEGDLGISYPEADRILHYLSLGYSKDKLVELGFARTHVETVWRRVDGTHWKRRLPTVAMTSTSAIGEYYLRPVDY